MSSVLEREALAQSPLADLHLIANELGVDGFRRLRRDDLIDAIVAHQAGAAAGDEVEIEADVEVDVEVEIEGEVDVEVEIEADVEGEADAEAVVEEEERPRPRRGRRGGRGRTRRDADEEPAAAEESPEPEERVVEGVVELLANGSAFIRLSQGETTDDDVYVSAAQVKRCELVSGDRIAGPVRAPRRSERFPSLARVDTINGRPADEVAEGTRFEELPVAWPSERLELGSDDVTLKAIEWLTPFGKGSRVVVTGLARAGKSETVRRLVAALAARAGEDGAGLELSVVVAGVRPEEIADWTAGPIAPVAALSFAASADAQAQAIEHAIEQGRRVAARGGDALVVVDTLAALSPHAARAVLAAARNLISGGSLTVIATAPEPFGGETTVIALDPTLTALRRFPALDLAQSGTLRADLLVGEAGDEAIARARAEAPG